MDTIAYDVLIMDTPKDFKRVECLYERMLRLLPVRRILFIGNTEVGSLVEEYKATTLGEFVEEVLKERPHEWGYISFNGSFVANRNRCEYANGKIKVDFPNNSVLNEPIYYVLGDGGWSRMDYEVYNGQ